MALEMKTKKEETPITDVTPEKKVGNMKPNLFGMEAVEDEKEINFDDYAVSNLNQVNVGNTIRGIPKIMKGTNEEKGYDYLILKVFDDIEMQCLNIYVNVPKFRNKVTGIRRYGFTQNLFNFIISVNRLIDPSSVIDKKTGDEVNYIKTINLQDFIDFIEKKPFITIEVIEGSKGYNSFKVIGIE